MRPEPCHRKRILLEASPTPSHRKGFIPDRQGLPRLSKARRRRGFREALIRGEMLRIRVHHPTGVSREQLMEALLSEEILEEQGCEGRRCTANEHCCGGHVCVDFDGASGTCLSSMGQREGAECRSDSECAAGLLCDMGSCVQFQGKKRYNEPCSVSTECEIGRGLCCQVVRRHRQAPKTLCGYFKDP
ncbi:hypothetical protein C7M84_008397 [Penaeus vannamei]|uniref:Dickkopf N-terminal cysteine-rich domain-containing protein n=1 Tax=Penaeus vannamei TaxID=6689 RepID=A0A3R7P1Y2_PENVA|nr:hypothetical protein C7M84_008397 [Penaeus vannamei]